MLKLIVKTEYQLSTYMSQWRSNRACKVSSECGPIAVGGPKKTVGGRGGHLPAPNLLHH